MESARLAALDVVVVEVSKHVDGDLLLLREQLGLDVTNGDLLRGVLGAVETRPVERLHVAQPLLSRLIRGGVLDGVPEHLGATRVQREVRRRHAERGDQLGILALALLIARAHQCDRPGDPEIAEHHAGIRRHALRTEQCDHASHQLARTFTVWPTVSSMCRR